MTESDYNKAVRYARKELQTRREYFIIRGVYEPHDAVSDGYILLIEKI